MIMIDALTYVDRIKTISRFCVTADNIFLRHRYFGESGLIENIAQTAAAGMGYNRRKIGRPIPIGYLGGIRNLRIKDLPEVNSELITTVSIENEILGIMVAHGEIQVLNHRIAECEMKFMIIND